jgi:hypothetical protein
VVLIVAAFVGVIFTLVTPLPWDFDKLRLHFVWFGGPHLLQSAGALLAVFAVVFITFVLIPFVGGTRIGNLEIPDIKNSRTRRAIAAAGWLGLVLVLIDLVGLPGVKWSRMSKTWVLQTAENAATAAASINNDSGVTIASIPEHYAAVNTEFIAAVNNSDTGGAMILVTAPGGFGKSFLVRHLQALQPNRVKLYKLSDYGASSDKPDLILRKRETRIAVNHLLDVPESRQKQLLAEVGNPNSNGIHVIDDFDEINADVAQILLAALSRIAQQSIHSRIVAVGRPEAFAKYLSDPHRLFTVAPKWVALRPPLYQTKGDVKSLIDFAYRDSGKPPTEEQTAKTFMLLSRHPYLRPMLGNLSHAIDMVKHARDTSVEKLQASSDKQIKRVFCDLILARNSNTHNRPSPTEPEQLRMYLQVIRKIAAEHSGSVESDGSFRVSELENVFSGDVSAQVQNVLNRSGLVTVQPLDTVTLQYRFSPVWLHRFFVDEYNSAFGGFPLIKVAGLSFFLALAALTLARAERLLG